MKLYVWGSCAAWGSKPQHIDLTTWKQWCIGFSFLRSPKCRCFLRSKANICFALVLLCVNLKNKLRRNARLTLRLVCLNEFVQERFGELTSFGCNILNGEMFAQYVIAIYFTYKAMNLPEPFALVPFSGSSKWELETALTHGCCRGGWEGQVQGSGRWQIPFPHNASCHGCSGKSCRSYHPITNWNPNCPFASNAFLLFCGAQIVALGVLFPNSIRHFF